MAHLIKGNDFVDERGKLRFINAFDMGEIVRFYQIEPANTQYIRAWQGHQTEKKWFYCLSGSFIINLIKIDNFGSPSKKLTPQKVHLDSDTTTILAIPERYATGIKANEAGSKLQVFSNFNVEESKEDDYRFPVDMWEADWH